MLVDSHCHLNLLPDHKLAVANALQAGVVCMQTICTSLGQMPELLNISESFENVFTSVGVHPCDIKSEKAVPSCEALEQFLLHKKVIGLGETGLDYYHEGYNKQLQRSSFANHIQASQKHQIPVIVHTRSADSDTIDILAQEQKNHSFPGLIHCFTSDLSFAKQVLDIGMYISVAGIVTFKNAETLQEVVKYVPLDRLLIETDSPYLAPHPFRGKPNEPAFVRIVAEKVASLKALSFEMVVDQTGRNFFSLFNKAKYK